MKFATSDLHFGHTNIIEYCDRKDLNGRTYSSALDMDSDIIDRINRRVKPGDSLYILGDFSMNLTLEETVDIAHTINGQKFLIAGNHDQYVNKKEFRDCFVWVKSIKSVKMAPDTKSMNMCHYPILSWNGMAHGHLHLHGHTHGSVNDEYMHPARIDVGWDVWGDVLSYDDIMACHEEQLDKFWDKVNVDSHVRRG